MGRQSVDREEDFLGKYAEGAFTTRELRERVRRVINSRAAGLGERSRLILGILGRRKHNKRHLRHSV